MKTLQLDQIRINGGTQSRVEMNQDVLADYEERLQAGIVFPPVVVFGDGDDYWLADGFHRYYAHQTAGRDDIAVDIQTGGLREAILHSVGANADHGLRRTNEDKRKAVETMLTNDIVSKDDKGNPWSNREIARKCCVDEGTVRNYRKSLSAEIPQLEKPENVAYTTKHGTKAIMNTANISQASKKRKRKFGGIARDAFAPKRVGQQFESRAAIELPYIPKLAANAIISVMGNELALKIANQIISLLKEN